MSPKTRPLGDVDPRLTEAVLSLSADKGSSLSSKAEVNSHNDHSTNKPLPWLVLIAVVFCTLSGISIGMQIKAESVIEAKIAAAIAPANEVARTASMNAKLAEDRANKMAAMLEARGLIKLENH